jgi:hypothetical protein
MTCYCQQLTTNVSMPSGRSSAWQAAEVMSTSVNSVGLDPPVPQAIVLDKVELSGQAATRAGIMVLR